MQNNDIAILMGVRRNGQLPASASRTRLESLVQRGLLLMPERYPPRTTPDFDPPALPPSDPPALTLLGLQALCSPTRTVDPTVIEPLGVVVVAMTDHVWRVPGSEPLYLCRRGNLVGRKRAPGEEPHDTVAQIPHINPERAPRRIVKCNGGWMYIYAASVIMTDVLRQGYDLRTRDQVLVQRNPALRLMELAINACQ